jgi:predicted HTH transcriptional regulator
MINLIAKTSTRSKTASMDLNALKALVKRGENQTLEFKLKANHPEKIVREVVAFANTDGGILLIGVDDDKRIQGLKFADEEEYVLVRTIEKLCSPPIEYELERLPLQNDRDVLIFVIPSSKQKPHFVLIDEDKDIKKAYIRIADRSAQASKEMRQLLKWRDKVHNVQFKYGNKEQALMQYLDAHPEGINVETFSTIAHIPRWLASKTLITLVLANVINVFPDETTDMFVMK